MTMSSTIVFRVDASLTIGTGHLVRCRNLARSFRGRGYDIIFVYRPHKDSIVEELLDQEFTSCQLPSLNTYPVFLFESSDNIHGHWLGCPETVDSQHFISLLRRLDITSFDYLVVDHYAIGKSWESLVKSSFPSTNIIAIDDLANREHSADYLVDANRPGFSCTNPYEHLVSKTCRLLLGPNYALSTPDYGFLSDSTPVRRNLKRILVFFGGVDSDDWCSSALEALDCDLFRDLEIDVVLGKGAPHLSKVCDYVSHMNNACLHLSVPTLSSLIVRADLAIGAGGTTTWERACLGLPSLVFSVSSNQIDGASALETAGAGFHLKSPSPNNRIKIIRDAVLFLRNSSSDLIRMSTNSKRLCDGKGLIRVLNAILGPPGPFSLHLATISDCDLYFNWANDPFVRSQSFNSEPILYPAHSEWFEASLYSDSALMFILKDCTGFPLGQIRFSRDPIHRTRIKISFSLDASARGHRLSTVLLDMGLGALCKYWEDVTIIYAQVKIGNAASLHSFLSYGFSEVASKDLSMRQFEIAPENLVS